MLQISSQGRRSNIHGFSLIELLVVLLIVGMGIGLVAINVGVDSSDLRMEAKQFANSTAIVAEEAVLSNVQLGLDLYRDIDSNGEEVFGYRWLQRSYWTPPEDSEDKPRWLWLPAQIQELAADVYFSSQLIIQLELEGVEAFIDSKREFEKKPELQQQPIKPDILLLANGEMSPFKLKLFSKGEDQPRHIVSGDLLGRIELDKPDED